MVKLSLRPCISHIRREGEGGRKGKRESKLACGWIEGEQSRAACVQELTWKETTVANDGVCPSRAATWDPRHPRHALQGAMSQGYAARGGG